MREVIYLNNAATSWPKPDCVAEAVREALIQPPGSMHRGGAEDFDVFQAVREKLAVRLGVSDPSRISLGANATWGLNMALFGFPLKSGDTVVTTCAEHNSVLRPLYDREQKEGVRVIYLDTDEYGRVPLQRWQEAMREYRPKLAVFNHASNVTGAVHDAAAMAGAAKEAGAAVLLDASQTLGYLDLRAENWGVDMVAFTGHKYLLGPQGTGGVWVREGLELSPRLQGGTGIQSDSDTMPAEMPIHLEAGTGNEPSFHGLLSALVWAEENPADKEKIEKQLKHLREGLQEQGARVICPEGETTPVVSFTLPDVPVSDAGYFLQAGCGIVCRTGLHCAPKLFACLGVPETIRLSLSRFTEDEEIEEVLQAVRDMREE